MAERTRQRVQRQIDREHADVPGDDVLCADRPWLNGWPRLDRGRAVLMGTGVHCVCCGRLQGVTCVAFPPDYEPPGPEPVWPFNTADCPLCAPYPPYK